MHSFKPNQAGYSYAVINRTTAAEFLIKSLLGETTVFSPTPTFHAGGQVGMTLYIPLDASKVHPNSPSFLVPSSSPETHLTTVIQTILKAKRIAVVCGAGISVEAGIPDFRSQDGLFQSLKRDNPKESLSSGKDLFDSSVFKCQRKTALFYRMIARLSSLSSQGKPTAFHRLLRVLDDRGQLLRVYTQNIDALEMKAGLSFGVPVFEEKELRAKLKGKTKIKSKRFESGAYNARLGGRRGTRPSESSTANTGTVFVDGAGTSDAGPSTSPQGISPEETVSRPGIIPRCIPLHGTLLTLHCQHCTQSFPLRAPSSHLTLSPPPSPNTSARGSPAATSLHSLLARGTPPPCPSCTSLEETRALVGKRLRGVGKLRPSVVLYGEEHREGEGVGEAVRRDLCGITDAKATPATPDKLDTGPPGKSRVRPGKGPDLLLVVGTSLRVPGAKRIVREFSKAVKPSTPPQSSHLPTPKSSPPATDRFPTRMQTIYLNFDFPMPAREWEGVFDVWVNGDVQMFAKAVDRVIKDGEDKITPRKTRSPSKDKDIDMLKVKSNAHNATPEKAKRKRKAEPPETPKRPAKKRKVNVDVPPTPISMPRRSHGHTVHTNPRSLGKIRKVILRLPPPPGLPTPRPSPVTRKHSIPEVVITSNPAIFARKSFRPRSLSPLTSLSSLTPSPPPISRSVSSVAVDAWRRDICEKSNCGTRPDEEVGAGDSSDEEGIPLAITTAKRYAHSHCSTYPGRPPNTRTYGSLMDQ